MLTIIESLTAVKCKCMGASLNKILYGITLDAIMVRAYIFKLLHT